MKLNTHKGTVVRARLTTQNGEIIEFHPLQQGVGGFAFNAAALKGVIDIAALTSVEHRGGLVLDPEGKPIADLPEYTDDNRLKSLTVLVVYPDGSIWEGEIGDDLSDVFLVSWRDEVIRSLVDEGQIAAFYSPAWQDTPTSLLVKGGAILSACSMVDHPETPVLSLSERLLAMPANEVLAV